MMQLKLPQLTRVAFLIGNVADLALGLKTGYGDFLEWYRRDRSAIPGIGWLCKDSVMHKELWADKVDFHDPLGLSKIGKEYVYD